MYMQQCQYTIERENFSEQMRTAMTGVNTAVIGCGRGEGRVVGKREGGREGG